jgi:ABC-type branched-subunit amino acid transport system substrate-binding protein
MRALLVLLVSCLFSLPLWALGPEDVLLKAREGASLEMLDLMIAQGLKDASPEQTSTWRMLEVWLRMKQSSRSGLQSLAAFGQDYPQSRYTPYLSLFAASGLAREEEFLAACSKLLPLLDHTDQELGALARGDLEVLYSMLAEDERGTLLAAAGSRSQLAFLESLAKKAIQRRIGLVLPLSGEDAEAGLELMAGARAAWEAALAGQPGWALVVEDCESDPVLAQAQLRALSESCDALIVLGQPEYVAAAGFASPVPVLFPGYDGRPLDAEKLGFFQFHADPAHLASAYAELAIDSLGLKRLITLAPASLSGKRFTEALMSEAMQRDSLVEFGQPQWYFAGAQDMRRQLENLCLYENAFDSLAAALVFVRQEDLKVFVPQMAWADPAHLLIANSALLDARDIFELRSLDGQLLVIADWLPNTRIEAMEAWRQELMDLEGRAASLLEEQAYESTRLLLLAGSMARQESRSMADVLQGLTVPSLFGGTLEMDGHHNNSLKWLELSGNSFRPLLHLDAYRPPAPIEEERD